MFNTKFSASNNSFDSQLNTNENTGGNDGFSPDIEIQQITNGYRIIITDKDGTESFDIFNGIDGKDGQDGKDGPMGPQGPQGAPGRDGNNGIDGAPGEDGIGINSIEINSKGELVLYYSNNTEVNLGKIVGADGIDGKDGANGQDGKSAYEIAKANGYVGTEQEWLVSLKGKNGIDGTNGKDGYTPVKGVDYFDGTNGADGEDGADGKSAYEIAKDNGFVGTEKEWLDSLQANVDVSDIIRYTEQGLTEEQQSQARENIGAGTSSFSGRYEDLIGRPEALPIVLPIYNSDNESDILDQYNTIQSLQSITGPFQYPFIILNYHAGGVASYHLHFQLNRCDDHYPQTFTFFAIEGNIKYTLTYIPSATDITGVTGVTRTLHSDELVYSDQISDFVSSDYFDSDEFAEKVIAALPVAETTMFPIDTSDTEEEV